MPLPVIAGIWLNPPHKKRTKASTRKRKLARRRHARKRKNVSTLTYVRNPKKKGGASMARVRHRRRRTKARKRTYGRKRHYRRRKRSNPVARRRYHRRRKSVSYSKPRRRYRRRRSKSKAVAVYRRRKRHGRRRRNPSTVSKAYRTGKSLFSMHMAKNVLAGAVGFYGVNVLAPFIPWAPAGTLGTIFRKGLAGVGAYMIGGLVLKSPTQKRYLLYGAALNIGLDFIQQYAGGYLPASAKGMSGFHGYGEFTSPTPETMRMIPTASIPTGA